MELPREEPYRDSRATPILGGCGDGVRAERSYLPSYLKESLTFAL